MSEGKLITPLDHFVASLTATPAVLEPAPGASRQDVASAIEANGGQVVARTFGTSLQVTVPLRSLEVLATSPLVGTLGYNGDTSGWGAQVTAATAKLDAFLTRLVSFLAATPVMVSTADGLQPEDRLVVAQLGGTIKSELGIVDAYTADLPLDRLAELAGLPRVRSVAYDTPLFPS